MDDSFYSTQELQRLGLRSFGENTKVSRKASIYSPMKISLGNNVRIDDFCILSGEIVLGSYIHISAHCCLYGSKKIILEDFSGLSPRTTIFSAMDDFQGDYLIGPIVPSKYTSVTGGPVLIKRFVQVGAGSTIFPNLVINEGAVIGAMSLVNKDINSWSIYAGIPAKFIKPRSRGLIEKAKNCLDQID